jgi:hypothetical protein
VFTSRVNTATALVSAAGTAADVEGSSLDQGSHMQANCREEATTANAVHSLLVTTSWQATNYLVSPKLILLLPLQRTTPATQRCLPQKLTSTSQTRPTQRGIHAPHPSLPTTAPSNTSNSPLKDSELAVLRAQYEKEDPYPSLQTKFNYAWGLIKSSARQEQQDGVRLLSEIFRASPDRRRECLYYLALGNYKLGRLC